MKKHLFSVVAVLLLLLTSVHSMAQMGPGRGPGPGMEGGMMGRQIAADMPDKLPAPSSLEWRQRLQEALDLERLSFAQYAADAEKFKARMPYAMVIHQEEDHIQAIERLFSAYGLTAADRRLPVSDTKTLAEALELCVKMERDLIPRYEWLVSNAEDRQSAAVIGEILSQTRHHLAMFERALSMGGRMGGGMMR